MTPFESYYGKALGRWRGHFAIQIKDPWALVMSPMPLPFKIQIGLLNVVLPIMGRFEMQTEVTMPHPNEVQHKFWLKKWGLTLYASEECFTTDTRGEEFTLELQDAFWLFLSQKQKQAPQRGRIFNASEALYQMPFMGDVYPMQTELQTEHFKMVLNTPWGQGSGQMTHITRDEPKYAQ